MSFSNLGVKSFQESKAEYNFSVKAISTRVNLFDTLIRKGLNIHSAGSYYNDFNFSNEYEIREKIISELNFKFLLEVIASFEAKLVFYFRNDIKRKSDLYKRYKSEVLPRYRNGINYLMLHHFIDVFRISIHPSDPILYSNFKQLVDTRNWLAHGRIWELSFDQKKFDLYYSFEVINELVNRFPNQPQYILE